MYHPDFFLNSRPCRWQRIAIALFITIASVSNSSNLRRSGNEIYKRLENLVHFLHICTSIGRLYTDLN